MSTIWDDRLDARGARLVPAAPTPGQEYWHLVEARWQDERESAGKHHIFIEPSDLRCRVWWPTGQTHVVKDFPMFSPGTPYSIQPDTGIPADSVHGLGLGSLERPYHAIHTAYRFRWELWVAGSGEPEEPEPQTLEERVARLEAAVDDIRRKLGL
jgi:hypothetical protein